MRRLGRRTLPLLFALAMPGLAAAAAPPDLPPETARLYAAFDGYRNSNAFDPKRLADLAAAPDGDLCLLDLVLRPNDGLRAVLAEQALANLHTPRTVARLQALAAGAGDTEQSIRAISVLGEIGDRQSVGVILDVLSNGNEERSAAAADALPRFHDPRIAPALLKAAANEGFVSEHAVSALATLKSDAVFGRVVGNFRRTDVEGSFKLDATADVAAYQNAAAADLLVGRMRDLDGKTDDESNELRDHTAEGLVEMLRPAEAALAPTLGELPDPFADEWDVYWKAARPLLTDTLRPKHTPATMPSPPVFAPADFAANADRVTFSVGVNSPVYRIGDPIRVDLRLTNTGTAPVSTIPPVPFDCWFPQMAYGIKLTHDGKTLFEIQPSSQYQGSFTGPPLFTTLAPGQVFRNSVCLQDWVDEVATPLPPGAYELCVTFNTAKFAGLHPTAVDRTHCWTATPVRFTVDGPALTKPADVLANIGTLVGRPFLEHDLTSENTLRRDSADEAFEQYGNSRLRPLNVPCPREYERPAMP